MADRGVWPSQRRSQFRPPLAAVWMGSLKYGLLTSMENLMDMAELQTSHSEQNDLQM